MSEFTLGEVFAFANDHLAPVIGEGAIESERGVLDAGDVGEAVLEVAVEGVQLFSGVAGERRIDADVDAVFGLKSEVLVLHLLQTAGEQAGSGEQDDGERGLHDDEGFLRKRGAVAGAAIGSAERFRRIGMRGEPCRGGAEEQAGDQGEDKGEAENGQRRRGVDGNEVSAVEGQRDDQLDSEKGDEHAGSAAQQGKDDAFSERLADEALSGGAEGEAHRGLSAAGGSAGQQQVGDIGAGDEQHQAAHTEQNTQTVAVSLLSSHRRPHRPERS